MFIFAEMKDETTLEHFGNILEFNVFFFFYY